jgi:hypothetical protein
VAGILIGGSNHAQLLFVRHVAARYPGEIGGQDVGQKPQLDDLSARERNESHSSVPPSATRFLLRAIVPPGSAVRRAIFCANDCRAPRSSDGSASKTVRSARPAPGALRNRSELGNLLLEGFATS